MLMKSLITVYSVPTDAAGKPKAQQHQKKKKKRKKKGKGKGQGQAAAKTSTQNWRQHLQKHWVSDLCSIISCY